MLLGPCFVWRGVLEAKVCQQSSWIRLHITAEGAFWSVCDSPWYPLHRNGARLGSTGICNRVTGLVARCLLRLVRTPYIALSCSISPSLGSGALVSLKTVLSVRVLRAFVSRSRFTCEPNINGVIIYLLQWVMLNDRLSSNCPRSAVLILRLVSPFPERLQLLFGLV
jgi:hypothetical protein